jgi:hypothetical protein
VQPAPGSAAYSDFTGGASGHTLCWLATGDCFLRHRQGGAPVCSLGWGADLKRPLSHVPACAPACLPPSLPRRHGGARHSHCGHCWGGGQQSAGRHWRRVECELKLWAACGSRTSWRRPLHTCSGGWDTRCRLMVCLPACLAAGVAAHLQGIIPRWLSVQQCHSRLLLPVPKGVGAHWLVWRAVRQDRFALLPCPDCTVQIWPVLGLLGCRQAHAWFRLHTAGLIAVRLNTTPLLSCARREFCLSRRLATVGFPIIIFASPAARHAQFSSNIWSGGAPIICHLAASFGPPKAHCCRSKPHQLAMFPAAEDSNNDLEPTFPANYPLDNVLSGKPSAARFFWCY